MTKTHYKFNHNKFLFHIVDNDYIVYLTKTVNAKKAKMLVEERLQQIWNPSYLATKEHDPNPFLKSIPFYVYDFSWVDEYRNRAYKIVKQKKRSLFFRLNNRVVVWSMGRKSSFERYTTGIVNYFVPHGRLGKLFVNMSGFVGEKDISKYELGYKEFNKDINRISNEIIKQVRDNYPDAEVDESVLKMIRDDIHLTILNALTMSRTKIADSCAKLLKTPVTIKIRKLEIKIDKLIGLRLFYGHERYDKTINTFIINVTISSFISDLPMGLWQLCNEDPLSILVKPKVKYVVKNENEIDDFLKKMGKSYKMNQLYIKPAYFIVTIADYSIVNKVKPIVISINDYFLSFILKPKSIKNFWGALSKVVKIALEKIMEFPPGDLIYNKLYI